MWNSIDFSECVGVYLHLHAVLVYIYINIYIYIYICIYIYHIHKSQLFWCENQGLLGWTEAYRYLGTSIFLRSYAILLVMICFYSRISIFACFFPYWLKKIVNRGYVPVSSLLKISSIWWKKHVNLIDFGPKLAQRIHQKNSEKYW